MSNKVLKFNRFAKIITIFVLIFSMIIPVFGKTASEKLDDANELKTQLEEEAAASKERLSELQNSAAEISEKIAAIEEEISGINSLIEEYQQQEAEIQQEINDLTLEIYAQETEIQARYEKMKFRIQYMYENLDGQIIEAIFSSDTISDMLQKIQYILDLNNYDKEMMEELETLVLELENSKTTIENDLSDLEALEQASQEQMDVLSALEEERSAELSVISANVAEEEANAASINEKLDENAKDIESLEDEIEEESAAAAAAAAASTSSTTSSSSSSSSSSSTASSSSNDNNSSSYSTSYSGGVLTNNSDRYGYLTTSQFNQLQQLIDEFLAKYITSGMSDLDKFAYAYKYIQSRITYRNYYTDVGTTYYNAYAVVYGYGDCFGFAKSMQAFCDAMGLTCTWICAYGNRHMWDEVYLYGQWYVVDVSTSSRFMVGSSRMTKYSYTKVHDCPSDYFSSTSAMKSYLATISL